MPPEIPTTGDKVSDSWLREVLLSSQEPFKSAEVLHLKKLDPQELDGVLSSVFKAQVSMRSGEVKKLFIKMLPSADDFNYFVRAMKLDVAEVEGYRTALPELARFAEKRNLGKDVLAIPKFIAGDYNLSEKNRGFYLILEDVSDVYAVKDFEQGLTAEETSAALRRLARFNAVAFCYGKANGISDFGKHYDFLNKFSSVFETDEGLHKHFDEVQAPMFLNSLKGVEDEKKLREVVESRLRRNICQRYFAVMKKESTKEFLVHGDLWANNVMFNNRGSDCLIVDWQFLSTGSVFLDFGLLAFLSMRDPKDSEANLGAFIDAYHSEFSRVCHKCGVNVPWNKEKFEKMVMTSGLFGTLYWCFLSIDLVEKYQSFAQRSHWVLRKCLQHCPEYLE